MCPETGTSVFYGFDSCFWLELTLTPWWEFHNSNLRAKRVDKLIRVYKISK